MSYTFTTKIGDYFNAIAYDVQNPAPTPILGAPGIFGNGGNVKTYSNITGAPAGSLGITLVSPDSGSVTNVPSAWVVGTDVLSRYHPMYAWLYNTFPSTSTGWSGTTTTTAAGRMIVIAPAPMPTSGANHINTVAYIGTGNTYSGSVSAIAPYLTAAYVSGSGTGSSAHADGIKTMDYADASRAYQDYRNSTCAPYNTLVGPTVTNSQIPPYLSGTPTGPDAAGIARDSSGNYITAGGSGNPGLVVDPKFCRSRFSCEPSAMPRDKRFRSGLHTGLRVFR